MFKILRNFRKSEAGAVTVDWVVLTAAVVGLVAAVFVSVLNGSTSVGERTGETLSNISVGG